MARTKNEGLIQVISLMPWWLCLTLAVILTPILHLYAITPSPAPDPQHLDAMMTGALSRGLATAGQYFAPLLLLTGGLISFLQQRRRRALLDNLPRTNKAMDGLTWRQFELLSGEAFRRQGFSVEETGGNGPDGGVDLVLRKDGELFLVQCKQWRALKVGVTTVRELYGVMAAEGAVGGFVVTSGRFTEEAKRFAEGRNVQLVDGVELERWVAVSRKEGKEPKERKQPVVDTPFPAAPVCPSCRSTMICALADVGRMQVDSFGDAQTIRGVWVNARCDPYHPTDNATAIVQKLPGPEAGL